MMVDSLDHVVLTVKDVQATGDFYERVLGLRVAIHEDDAKTFHFGEMYFGEMYFGAQKINLHEAGHEFEPKAHRALPGTGDLCFLTAATPDQVVEHLHTCGVAILEGPVPRQGARGPMTSVYFRDPDQNLVEIAHYD